MDMEMETIRRAKYFGELTLWNQSWYITKADTILEGMKNLALNTVFSIIIKSVMLKILKSPDIKYNHHPSPPHP